MRKHYILFFLSLCFCVLSFAQVNYNFTATTGTYTALSGGTTPTLVTPNPDPTTGYTTTDEGFANAVPIGFTFNYNGVPYTAVNINVNGYLTLGSPFLEDPQEDYYYDSLSAGPTTLPGTRPIIAPFWGDHDIQVESNLTYAVSGTAPNRVFTVEWANVLWRYTATNPSISFQVKLYETTGVIEYIYRNEAGTPTSPKAAIGLTSEGVGPGNFLALSDASSAPTVSSTVEAKIRTRPATDQIYRFTPLSCIPPTNAALSNVTPTGATLTYTAVTGAAGYEFVVSTSGTDPVGAGTPTTGTTVNLTGFVNGVNYVFVRTNCGGGSFSLWKRLVSIPCTTNILPVDGAVNVSINPSFSWHPVAGATAYSLMIGLDTTNFFEVGPFTDTTADLTGGDYSTTYYWYVRAHAGTDMAPEACSTNATSFTTVDPPTVPTNDDVCSAIALTLDGPSDCENTTSATDTGDPQPSCSVANNTVWYTYTPTSDGNVLVKMKKPTGSTAPLNAWVAFYTATGTCPGGLTLTQAFACSGADLTTEDSVLISAGPLTSGTTYYVMIDGFAGAVGEFCISLVSPPPAPTVCATLLTPANNATNVSVPAAPFAWNSVPSATGYTFYLGTALPPDSLGVTPDTTVTITGLAYNTTYYWSAVPQNAGGQATGCPVYSFTTAAPPPPPANDDCSGAFNLPGAQPTAGTTVGATQSLPAIACGGFTGDANDDVWYSFTASNNGDATIILTPDGQFDGVMELLDGTCGSFTSLGCADGTAGGGTETLTVTNLIAGTTYYLRLYEYGGSGEEGTFSLQLTGSILPIKLADFKGERSGSRNLLSWNTQLEQNNKGFELQRSADGENFSTLAFVASKAENGNSNRTLSYTYYDQKPLSSNNYYRLKQTDIDGKTTLSNIVLIKGIKSSNLEITSVYPNPAKSDLRMVLNAPASDEVRILVTDLAGKVLMQQPVRVVSGDNNFTLNVAKFAAGSYLVKVVCANGCESSVSKFIKQ